MVKFAAFVLGALFLTSIAGAGFVPNGDFEATEDFESWFHTSGNVTEVADNGPSLAGMEAIELYDNGSYAAQLRSVALPVAPGDVLTLTFDHKTLEGTVDWWYQQVRFHSGADENGNAVGWVGEVTTPIQAQPALGWQTRAIPNITVPANTNYIDLIFNAGIFSANFDGTLRLDNIEVSGSSVPEPMTMSLLALGLVALRRK